MLWSLIFTLILLILGGLYGGIAMLADPSGSSLGLDGVIDQLPVSDYVLPGLFVGTAFGLVPILLGYALIMRLQWSLFDRLFRWCKHYWAWTSCLLLAGTIAVWLTYEGLLIGMYPITNFTALLGFLILVLSLLPSVRRYYADS
jgi:hypothetical protein